MSKLLLIHSPAGQILRTFTGTYGDPSRKTVAGERWLEVEMADPLAVTGLTHRVAAGAVVELPPRPSQNHVFDYALNVWREDFARADLLAREKRDALLTSTDWTQLPDVPAATSTTWRPYRQALRDLTSQPGYPFTINWPLSP